MKYKILLALLALIVLAIACAPAIDDETTAPSDEVGSEEDADETTQPEADEGEVTVNETSEAETSEQEPADETVTNAVTNATETEESDEQTGNETNTNVTELPEDAKLIAGNVSKYYEWNRELFDKFFEEGKSILLVFSTETYPASVKQDEAIEEGFAELDIPRLVGFKVPFRDSRATEEHAELALEHGVGTIMTKAMIKNKSLVYKDTERWDKQDFIRKATQFS